MKSKDVKLFFSSRQTILIFILLALIIAGCEVVGVVYNRGESGRTSSGCCGSKQSEQS